MTPPPLFYQERRLISTMLPLLFELLFCTDLQENLIKMEELTSMYSSVSINGQRFLPYQSSILEDLTQTSNRYLDILRNVGTMPEREVTSFMNVDRDLETLELLAMDATAYSKVLCLQRQKTIFIARLGPVLREILCYIREQLRSTLREHTRRSNQNTFRPPLRRMHRMEFYPGTNSPESGVPTDSEDEENH